MKKCFMQRHTRGQVKSVIGFFGNCAGQGPVPQIYRGRGLTDGA